jgi:CelD/BcsL family acetyltransferase involved in cellulose biosynthesis
MRYIIDRYGERGSRSLDLGIGSDDYKRMFCKDDEEIFDSFVPLTSRGKLAAMAMSSLSHGKRLVKQNPMLFDLARRVRQAFG